ncbi:MAG: hypothetical protein SFW36_05715, partial [Leptolyngbyaceae cyanobacterium bins.59]|nr:hypothetical protein [Leptolyngbyaceae cyanobacterium bins.59]
MSPNLSLSQAFSKNLSKESAFWGLSLLIFFGLGLLGVFTHEMWRDEIRIWMILRDSHSWGDLYYNLRYETGHFFPWYLLLYPFSRLTRNPIALQILHLLTSTAVAYVVLRYAPFSRLQRLLLTFGYFLFYEYSIVVRNYGFSLLFLFLFCVLFGERDRQYWRLAFLLALFANVNYFSWMLANALGIVMVIEFWLHPNRAEMGRQRKTDLLLSLGLWLGSAGLAVLQMIPPPGVEVSPSVDLSLERFASTLASLWKSYAPMPGLAHVFWNTNILDDGVSAVLSVGVLGFALTRFSRYPIVLLLYILGTGQLLAFFLLKHGGGVRHWGYLFVVFIVCLWLTQYFPASSSVEPKGFWHRHQPSFLMFCLSVQFAAGAFAFGMDVLYPFSEAQNGARVIQAQGLVSLPKVGYRDYTSMTVSGFLDQPIYYPESGRSGTFLLGFNIHHKTLDPAALWETLDRTLETGQEYLLILSEPISTPHFPAPLASATE